jgi:hypothetical protein
LDKPGHDDDDWSRMGLGDSLIVATVVPAAAHCVSLADPIA